MLGSIKKFFTPTKHYKYTLAGDRTFSFHVGVLSNAVAQQHWAYENKWCALSQENGTSSLHVLVTVKVKAGYSWDGCSPKYRFMGLSWGTPDGWSDQCKDASMVHDVFCQFRQDLPRVSKSLTLCLFYNMLLAAKWPLTSLYVRIVDRFGPQDWLGGN